MSYVSKILAICLLSVPVYGMGTEKNIQEALSWFTKSAQQENSYAQCRLGDFYEFGLGTEVDHQKAFEWYQRAADQGLPGALAKLKIRILSS